MTENSNTMQDAKTLVMQLVTPSTENIVTENFIANAKADAIAHYEFMAGELSKEYQKAFKELNILRGKRTNLQCYIDKHKENIFITSGVDSSISQLAQIQDKIQTKQIELCTIGRLYKMAVLKADDEAINCVMAEK